jgi:Leucine-rich repeat
MISEKLGPKSKLVESDFEIILLDGTRLLELTESDKAYLEKFTGAKTMSMCNCGLRNLKNLPVLPNIQLLDLADNQLTGEDLGAIYHAFKKLKQLILANNSIRDRDLSHIAQLAKCQQLQSLDLSANPLTEMQSYRENVFEKLPHLEALDGFNKDGDEWSVLDDWELREDEDYWLHHNPELMDDNEELPYTTETMLMRKDGDDSEDSSNRSEDESQEEFESDEKD